MPRGFRLQHNVLLALISSLSKSIIHSPQTAFLSLLCLMKVGCGWEPSPGTWQRGRGSYQCPELGACLSCYWQFSLSLALLRYNWYAISCTFQICILTFVYTCETIPRAEMANLFVTPSQLPSAPSKSPASTPSHPSSLHPRPPLICSPLLQIRSCFLDCPVSGNTHSILTSPGFFRSAQIFPRCFMRPHVSVATIIAE